MAKLTFLENGPILFEASGTYVFKRGGQEETLDQKAVAFCRCGASANKPFCDGSHKRIDFKAEGGEITLK